MKIDGNTSDGYHTFNELYEFRMIYNAALFNEWASHNKYETNKSWKHHDGEWCFGNEKEWFIVTAKTPFGVISNHYPASDWDLFKVPETEISIHEYDGHTARDVVRRLRNTIKLEFAASSLEPHKVGFEIQRLQLEYKALLKQYDVEWVSVYFGDDITQVADYYIENNFEISVDCENKYLNWEITCNDGDNVVIHKTGYVDFFWLEGGDIDEQKEMKKVLINELRHLIEDRELVDVKNRTITLLEEKEVEELKRVLEKLNS